MLDYANIKSINDIIQSHDQFIATYVDMCNALLNSVKF